MWVCLNMWVPENCYYQLWKNVFGHLNRPIEFKIMDQIQSTSNPKLVELPTEPQGHWLLSCKEVKAGHVLSSGHEHQGNYDIQELWV